MQTPTLETGRITLRPLQTTDAEAIYTNWATDPVVTRYLRWDVHESPDVTRAWLAAEEEAAAGDDSYQWAFIDKENGTLFGSGGLARDKELGLLEIGYVVMQKYWGCGYTTEAARAMVAFAVNTLQESRLFAKHAKGNPASGRVLEKAGFVYQRDGSYTSFDGERVFESREYILTV